MQKIMEKMNVYQQIEFLCEQDLQKYYGNSDTSLADQFRTGALS